MTDDLGHINNLYNTCFWSLIQLGGMKESEATERLKGTVSADKHDILFKQYKINYNTISEQFKRGSTLLRSHISQEKLNNNFKSKNLTNYSVHIHHLDICKDSFWKREDLKVLYEH